MELFHQALDEYLYGLHCALFSIDHLSAAQWSQQAQQLLGTGSELQIIVMLRASIQEYRGERGVIKYVHVMDKLLKIPQLGAILQSGIIELYVEVFIALLLQKCYNEIEEIKLIRKFWLGIVHPTFLSRIREIIMVRVGVDVDMGFKNQAINVIRNHYVTKLGMSLEEAALHLPQLRKKQENQPQIMHPATYYREMPVMNREMPVMNRQMQMQIPNGRSHPMPHQMSLQMQQTPQMPMQQMVMQQQLIPSAPQSINPMYYDHQPSLGYLPPSRINQPALFPINKRPRLSSDETKFSQDALQFPCSQPKKIVHESIPIASTPSEPSSEDLRRRLLAMTSHECKECGMRFATGCKYDSHTHEHIRQKLNRLDKGAKRMCVRGSLAGRREWVGISDKSRIVLDKFCISMSSLNLQCQYQCLFCCRPFARKFINNDWVLAQAVRVQVAGKESLMHKACQASLDISSEEDEDEAKCN